MNRILVLTVGAVLLSAMVGSASAAVRYVDSENGDDAASGASPESAWRSLDKVNAEGSLNPGDTVLFKRGGLWRGQLRPRSGEPGVPIVFDAYGTGVKPIIQGSIAADDPKLWVQVSGLIWKMVVPKDPRSWDIGQVIYNHGAGWGVKRWHFTELVAQDDYCFDRSSGELFVCGSKSPAERWSSIELAQTFYIVDFRDRHDLVFRNLFVRYSGAHGFGGHNVQRITIRDCDIAWIGGGWMADQLRMSVVMPIRYGNGVEFYGYSQDCEVSGCRIWEVYDAALSNQGNTRNGLISHQKNIFYRNNVIWNSEYSFEYWNRPAGATTENVVFENNVCLGAGYGWGHAQRRDPCGTHLKFYENTATVTNFFIRNNVFGSSTDGTRSVSPQKPWPCTEEGNVE